MFARSEHDGADVAVDTCGFVLRAGCSCEFVQFLLDFVRPNGVQHLHDLITRAANYERRLRLIVRVDCGGSARARFDPRAANAHASMPAPARCSLSIESSNVAGNSRRSANQLGTVSLCSDSTVAFWLMLMLGHRQVLRLLPSFQGRHLVASRIGTIGGARSSARGVRRHCFLGG